MMYLSNPVWPGGLGAFSVTTGAGPVLLMSRAAMVYWGRCRKSSALSGGKFAARIFARSGRPRPKSGYSNHAR